MAEELASQGQEQEQLAPQESELTNGATDLQALQNSAIQKIRQLQSSLNLPARPESIDIYKNVAGNPITGSNPGAKIPNNGADYIRDMFNKTATSGPSETAVYGAMRPFSYNGDTDGANFERYHSSGDLYNKIGFSPYRDNESLYNDKMTFGDEFVRAASQWDNLVGTGFRSGIRSWSTLFTDPLAPDLEGAREMERAMAIGSSTKGGIGGFFVNTFLNSGYTIGIGADFLAEELALMGATALTGGAAGLVGAPVMVGKGLRAMENIFQGSKVLFAGAKRMENLRAINSVPEMKSLWTKMSQGTKSVVRETANILNPLDQTVDALRATDYASNYAKMTKTFGAFADDMLMMKGAVSEAKLEGGMAKITITEDLVAEYRSKNGKDPDGAEMLNIEKIANDKAYQVAFWNLPAITTSNKLMYATMLAPLRSVMGREGAVKLVDDYLFNGKTFSAVGEGFLSKGKAALQSFTKPKFYGQFGMNYLKANFAEGIQENLQEAISSGAAKHAMQLYTDPIKAGYEGYMPHFMQGLGEQFSAQGAETFAGGFAMGMFAQPVMAAPSVAISKLVKAWGTENYAAAEKLNKEFKAKNVQYLNDFYDKALITLAPDIDNSITTGRLADDMYTAARNGKKKEAIDAIESIKDNKILVALQTGKLDIMINKVAQYKNLSRAEVVEAFGKYGIKEQDVDSALGKIDGIVARANQLKKDYEDVAEKYPNPFNPNKFILGTSERKAAEIAYKAWETAKYNLTFAKATYTSHSKRVADVANIFSNISNDLAKADAQNLMTLLNPATTKGEILALRQELSVLDDNVPEQKKLKAEKTKQLETINNFYEAVKAVKEAKTPEEKEAKDEIAKKAFMEHVKFLAKKNDHIVFNEDIEKAYSVVKDHMSLKDDMKGLAESINVLMAPQNFFKLHTRLNDAYSEILNNKEGIIEENQKLINRLNSINGILNLVTIDSGLNIPNELIEAYVEALDNDIEMPVATYFMDAQGNKVTAGPQFDIALKLFSNFTAIAAKEKEDELKNKPVKTLQSTINEILANRDFIKLSEDGTHYVNTKTGKKYDRVTNYIADEKSKNDFKDGIEKGEDIEDYKQRLIGLNYKGKPLRKKLTLASSQIIGTKVDVLVRDFFNGELKDLSTYDVSSLEEVQAFVKGLEQIKEKMDARGEKVLANDILLYDDNLGVAGTVDLLTYTESGDIRIYDMKSMRGNQFTEVYFSGINEGKTKYDNVFEEGKDSNKVKHQKQLSLYRILLNNTHNIRAKTLAVMPIEVIYQPGDVVTSELNLLPGVRVTPLDQIKDAKLLPLKNQDTEIISTLGPKKAAPKTEEEAKEQAIEAETKRLLMQPRESLTPAEEKALRFGLPGSSTIELRKQFIEKRIELLEKKAEALGLDAIEITDTLAYLDGILNTTTESIQNNLKNIDDQIKSLNNIIKSKSSKKTAKGIKAQEKIVELKASYRAEFQLLNDITDRVKELQEELSDVEAVQQDLQKQAQYYSSLISDPTLTTYTRDELIARRDKINSKINTIGKLLIAVRKAIADSIRYIKEHVSLLFQTDKNLKTFISDNEFENFQYPAIKNKLESLQNEVLNNINSAEFLEVVKTKEEERQAQLLAALLKYQDQVRYLSELIDNYKENNLPSPKGIRYSTATPMTLNAKEVVASKQKEYPVTISRKNARIQSRIKEAKLAARDVAQAETVTVPTGEVVVSTLGPTKVTSQQLNENLNLKSLKVAQTNKFQVIYDNIQYKIEKVGTNSVTLKSALGAKVTINEDNLVRDLRIVQPGIEESTVEENEIIKANEKLVSEEPKEFKKTKAADKEDYEKRLKTGKTNLIENLC
jgi:hypothetical protein